MNHAGIQTRSAGPLQPGPGVATLWQLRTRTLTFGRRPLLMGIINVTPDSFSDGGQCVTAEAAIERGRSLAAEGADLLDIGGESTRPYSAVVPVEEELHRVLPVVEQLAREISLPLSIDTSKAAVARAALDRGVEIVNDVTGLTGDAEMLPLVAAAGCGVCAMHMRGTPQTMQDDPKYDDVVAEVAAYLRTRRDALIAAGVAAERICLDPGIGFGKTHEHNRLLLANCYQFHALACPLLVGHSRKGFIGKLIGDQHADRTAGTLGAACALARQQVQIVRVHDVAAVRQALVLFEAGGGLDR